MAEPSPAAPARHAVRLTLTASGDSRYLDTLRALTTRLATVAGLREAAANHLGEAVRLVAHSLVPHLDDRGDEFIEVQYASDADAITASLCCPQCDAGADSVEQAMARAAASEAVRTRVDRVSVGQQGGTLVCRLVCELPTAER